MPPRMGGCQLGFQGDHEVSILLLDGAGCTWRDAFDGFCRPGQVQDAGTKMIHFRPEHHQQDHLEIYFKRRWSASYRGLLKVYKDASGARSNASCEALLLDPRSPVRTPIQLLKLMKMT